MERFVPDVSIVEVGPRDGLQNEKQLVPTAVKRELIQRLVNAGLKRIEVTSFVSPKWVPQMADHAELLGSLPELAGVCYSVLTPNLRGFEAALDSGAREVAIFAAASETFSVKNVNCSIEESLRRFEPVLAAAAVAGVRVRGYVSCVAGCPYEGEVAPIQVAAVAKALHRMGCYEISLGDTIGSGGPADIVAMLDAVAAQVPVAALAGHFHDTRGTALRNIVAAHEFGLRTFDASIGGLGGCPYAPGASGNVATEQVAMLFKNMGIDIGLDYPALAECSAWISGQVTERSVYAIHAATQPIKDDS